MQALTLFNQIFAVAETLGDYMSISDIKDAREQVEARKLAGGAARG